MYRCASRRSSPYTIGVKPSSARSSPALQARSIALTSSAIVDSGFSGGSIQFVPTVHGQRGEKLSKRDCVSVAVCTVPFQRVHCWRTELPRSLTPTYPPELGRRRVGRRSDEKSRGGRRLR